MTAGSKKACPVHLDLEEEEGTHNLVAVVAVGGDVQCMRDGRFAWNNVCWVARLLGCCLPPCIAWRPCRFHQLCGYKPFHCDYKLSLHLQDYIGDMSLSYAWTCNYHNPRGLG